MRGVMGKKVLSKWGFGIVFVAIVALFLALRLNVFGGGTAYLMLTNKSASDIFDIEVVLNQEPCIVQRLDHQASTACTFQIKFESHYKISWRDSYLKTYKNEFGYVTDGFDFKHELIFLGDDEVRFKVHEII